MQDQCRGDMRVLILGGDGMLGHELAAELAKHHELTVSLRQGKENYRDSLLFGTAVFGIDARDTAALSHLISTVSPEVVVNAIGIVKQRDDGADTILSLQVNALLPHQLAKICAANRAHRYPMP